MKTTADSKNTHDILGAVRFLENLHTEMAHAESLNDIQDEQILRKFSEVIEFIKEQFKDALEEKGSSP